MNNESAGAEKRRALRLRPPDVEVSLTIDQQILERVSLVDMSTLGIGVELGFPPKEGSGKFKFKNPDHLRGLVIKAQSRYVQERKRPDGNPCYRVGYEFLFSSAEQQNQLLRWMAEQVKMNIHGGMAPEVSSEEKSGKVPSLEVRFPQNEAEFEKCLELMNPLTVYHAMIQTKFFMVIEKGEILAVLPLYQDILPFRLPAKKAFPEDIRDLKAAGGSHLGEIGLMSLNRSLPVLQEKSLSPWYQMEILMALFQHVFFYARDFARLTYLVSVVPPPFEEFYRLWLFKESQPPAKGFFQKENQEKRPGKFFWIDLEKFENKAATERPEIVSWMIRQEKETKIPENLSYSYCPNARILQEWFCGKSRIFESLKIEEASYFRFCFPDFFPSHKS